MMSRSTAGQRGMAVFHALITALVLGVALVALRQHVTTTLRLAEGVQWQASARLACRNATSNVVAALIEHPWSPSGGASQASLNAVHARWNFHGEWFAFDGVDVAIQDHNGLIPIAYEMTPQLEHLVSATGLDARAVEQRMAESMSGDLKPLPFQTLDQLATVLGDDPSAPVAFPYHWVSLRFGGLFNPATAPNAAVVAGILSDVQARELMAMRSRSATEYADLIDRVVTTNSYVASVGPIFRVTCRASEGSATYLEGSNIEVRNDPANPVRELGAVSDLVLDAMARNDG